MADDPEEARRTSGRVLDGFDLDTPSPRTALPTARGCSPMPASSATA
jgi:hypothetical protein